MNFPVWELGFAPGLLIAIMAILHVFVSHFAVGTGLFLVLTERKAYRNNDHDLLTFLKKHSLVFIMFSVVFGAITGVGIWFVIGLINPAATSSLIHGYVFGWAIEWVFFIIEILSGLIYYYGWNRLSRKIHLTIGWIYFIAAWMSMVIINGIITFMLTPGGWLKNHEFWTGFFNPTYWPSLASRTFWSFALAGIYALLTGSFQKDANFHKRITRYAGVWVIISMILSALGLVWYWHAMPDSVLQAAAGAMPITTTMLHAGYILFIVTIVVVFLTTLVLPRLNIPPVAILVMLLSLGIFGASEWVRESVRKPYTIHGYIYSNGIFPANIPDINQNGVLLWAKWISDEAKSVKDPVRTGAEIFRIECKSCHTISGYMGIADKIKGWDKEFIFEITGRLPNLRGQMAPFAGTVEERWLLAEYLLTLTGEPRTYADGRDVFQDRCAICHTVGGFRNIAPLVADFSFDELNKSILPGLPDMNGQMPALTVDEDARAKLAKYLESLKRTEVSK